MGHSQSKAQSKSRGPKSGQSASERLYPNLASEFPTYGPPNTVDFRGAPMNTYEACFGNTMPNFVHEARPSYCYNPVPSAPPEILSVAIPAIQPRTEQSFMAKHEDCKQTRQAETSGIQNRGNNNEDKNPAEVKPCPNAGIGCKLHFNAEQMKQHLKECLFRDVPCPLNGVFGKCSWRDKVKNIMTHFEDNHPENIGQVNQENTLTGLRTIHLVEITPYKFLVHIKVDEVEMKTFVAVQAYSTQFCASKWTYEIKFTGPHMEKTLKDTCFTAAMSIEQKFKKMQCRVLPMSICVMDGFKHGGLTYTYRIMQTAYVGVTKKLQTNRNTGKEGTSGNAGKAVKSRNKRIAAAAT